MVDLTVVIFQNRKYCLVTLMISRAHQVLVFMFLTCTPVATRQPCPVDAVMQRNAKVKLRKKTAAFQDSFPK